MIEVELHPFVIFAPAKPRVRLYTIGPEHLDWLCAYCGKTGNLDGHRLDRWVLALGQVNIARALEEGDDVEARMDRLGWEIAWRRCRRTALEHVQQHLRFDHVQWEDR